MRRLAFSRLRAFVGRVDAKLPAIPQAVALAVATIATLLVYGVYSFSGAEPAPDRPEVATVTVDGVSVSTWCADGNQIVLLTGDSEAEPLRIVANSC